MRKIATLFDRDWSGAKGVIPEWSPDARGILQGGRSLLAPTEKLDGTNVRLTVRSGQCVRVEARVNPSKEQKAMGIKDPWYRDSQLPRDQHIMRAVGYTSLDGVIDGEWSGEAIGHGIQGDPLGLGELGAQVVLFSLARAPYLENAPRLDEGLKRDPGALFREIKAYLETARSALNPEVPIEGIVWANDYGDSLKIKVKDFKD